MKEKVLGEFTKNAQEKVVVQFVIFNSHPLLDIRVYAKSENQFVPTKKGISIPFSRVGELKVFVNDADEEIGRLGSIVGQTQ